MPGIDYCKVVCSKVSCVTMGPSGGARNGRHYQASRTLAPRTHNLVRLADAAGLDVPPTIRDILGEMNEFVLTGRYPDAMSKVPALGEARILRQRAEEAFAWLMQQL